MRPSERLREASAYFVKHGGELQRLAEDVAKTERQVHDFEEALAETQAHEEILADLEDLRRGIRTQDELFERWL